MHCKNCDYPLWNIPTRQCPECGTPFKPSEFEFVRNSVQFCCPRCGQVYYGTDVNGHLFPVEFDCVSCGEHLHMDRMLLRPAEGVEERQTRLTQMPWLERRQRGHIKAWFATVLMSMGQPIRLMKSVPEPTPAGNAWGYALLTLSLFVLAGFSIPLAGFSLFMSLEGNPDAAGMAISSAGALVGGATAAAIFIGLWGLVTHGMLRITGGCTHTIHRTYQALCYSSGAMALIAIPCLGPYCGVYMVWIWWAVSAILMVSEGQKVHGGRATLAVLAWPCTLVLLFIGAYVVLIFSLMAAMPAGAMMGGPMMTPYTETKTVSQELIIYAYDHDGNGPGHAAQLVPANNFGVMNFVSVDTATFEDNVVLPGGTTLIQLEQMLPNRQRLKADEIAAAMPEHLIAHRVGDFVFTYHGIDFDSADGSLWIVLFCPDPDVNGRWSSPTVFAGCIDGTTQPISPQMLNSSLRQQNRLRADAGLPPLPDPMTVTHDKPAVAK